MGLFRKKQQTCEDPAEKRFNAIMELVKGLERKEYNKLKKAMDQSYEAYSIIRGIETEDDKVDKAEVDFIETTAKKRKED